MFKTKRYTTARIAKELPLELQVILWSLIDGMDTQDPFQFFTLIRENGNQKIIHEQEEPEYRKEYIFRVPGVDAKVYVIDDSTHTTMLFAEEH